jgi:phosphatidylserine/phosphatidylglycerophosphate/cardiolipin synthase-like enzyme
MFMDDLFGPDVRVGTPHPSLTIDGIRVETYFSPDDGAAARLKELIETARESIYFMAFSFTSDELAEAIIKRAEAGITVAGVLDESQVLSNTGGEWERMNQAGLEVRLDGNPRNMHHKVMIIDGEVVVTGSYNFTANAETRNDENLLVIYSSRIASQYMVEFQRVYDEGRQ